MKAAIIEKFGNPEDVLHAGEAPIPEPQAGQVLVKTTYAVIHNHNIVSVKGTYGVKPQLPHIEGSEATGVVEKLGEGVTNVKVGQRVSVARAVTGTWAEYFVAGAASLVPIPDAVDDKSAAQITSMPLSAYLLLDTLGVKEGDWFIYNGANGLVGVVLAYLAKAKGINMIKVVRRAAAKKSLEDLGFEHVVVSTDSDYKEQVKKLAGGANIVAAVDNVGGQDGADLFSLTGQKGRLVIFGALSAQPIPVNPGEFIFYNKTIVGFWASSIINEVPKEKLIAYQTEIVKLVATGQIKFTEGGVYSLDDIQKAATATVNAKEGKILLKA